MAKPGEPEPELSPFADFNGIQDFDPKAERAGAGTGREWKPPIPSHRCGPSESSSGARR